MSGNLRNKYKNYKSTEKIRTFQNKNNFYSYNGVLTVNCQLNWFLFRSLVDSENFVLNNNKKLFN